MLTSLGLIFLTGMALGWICRKCRLPGLLGMMAAGILLGPCVLDLLDDSILNISADLRQIALIIILTRAGLSLNLEDLKKVGRPAVLLCFVPASFEMAGIVLLAPPLLHISYGEAAILGAVLAAVSPAVIVPKMLKLMEEKRGTGKSIPQMLLAGASVDDVFVIVMFTSFMGLEQGGSFSPLTLVQIPVSIITGIAAGLGIGLLLALYFKKVHIRDSLKVVILLSISCILVSQQDAIGAYVPFSGLLAVMSMGVAVQKKREPAAVRLSVKYSKLWTAAEVLLFVLVGATVDLQYVAGAGLAAVALIFGALIFRMAGVTVCLLKTPLNRKERLFCTVAYMPKATVQAAIGGLPLAAGLACGHLVLIVAVLVILITAPLGAFGIDLLYRRCLQQEPAQITEKIHHDTTLMQF